MRAVQPMKRVLRRFSRGQRGWLNSAAAITIAALACSAYWFALRSSHSPDPRPAEINSGASPNSSADSPLASGKIRAAEANQSQSARTVYPYSIVPGGIHSVAELKAAIATDAVVSAEYSGFHLEDARVIRLDHDRSVHVSYRVGDRVFWTSRELKLAKGETLITDGVVTARTKCGNLISDDFVGPVSPNEPTELALNTPLEMHYDPGDPASDDRFPELVPPPAGVPSSSSYLPSPPEGGRSTPLVPILLVPQPSPRPYAPAPPPPSPPIVNAPEPGTEIQFLVALLGILWLSRRKRKADGRA
ncbi:MAG TPA: hypothetical protein VNZ63_04285 [Verrucomicrobiae bacterium]|jgi:hypothetical protein|nr:hypothetical protein [Verrucomicrobiae bacterium]